MEAVRERELSAKASAAAQIQWAKSTSLVKRVKIETRLSRSKKKASKHSEPHLPKAKHFVGGRFSHDLVL